MIVSLDFETRSRTPIEHGSHAYARNPSTSILCMAYKIDEGETQLWVPGDPFPDDLREAIEEGATFRAFNAYFERCIWWFVGVLKLGWPPIPDDNWTCTAAQVAVLCLPRNLGDACIVMNLSEQKDKRGKALIDLLCVPQKITKKNTEEWNNDPVLLQELGEYCIQDVNAEYALAESVPKMGIREQATWLLDQKINHRGIPIDVESVQAALDIMEQAKAEARLEIGSLTDFAATAGTHKNQIIEFCQSEIPGLEVPNMQKATVEALLEDPRVVGTRVETLLKLRQEGSKASTGKYSSMAATVAPDGRVRDVLLYYGANTGRWSGKKMQPHNFPRIGVPDELIPALVTVLRQRSLRLLGAVFGRPMSVLSKALRNMIEAPPGKKFVVVDFSAIEARVLAWLAGEEWKVQAFRDFDAGILEKDNYVLAAEEINRLTGLPAERQIGKVAELSLGYQGGVGAWSAMAKNYGLDLGDSEGEIADKVTRKWCLENWGGLCKVLELPVNSQYRDPKQSDAFREAYVDSLAGEQWRSVKRHALADTIKTAWREAHPQVTQFWKDVNKAACNATQTPGPHYAGPICFYRQGRFLYCRLPCGRNLCYPDPMIESRPVEVDENGVIKKVFRDSLRYKRHRAGAWRKEFTYGGSLVENITQAVSRDLLVEAMFAAEKAGYPVTFHVHDEIISEVDEDFGSAEHLAEVMTVIPTWAEGCPIAAAGFEDTRYHK